MADGATREIEQAAVAMERPAGRRRARLLPVSRRGPVLQPARGADPEAGIFGLDLTAGCGIGCPSCAIRGASRYPGEGLVRFDPATTERLVEALERLPRPPRRVILSPSSDPLPPDREIRAETLRVVRTLLERRIDVLLMTRGRIGPAMAALLAAHAGRVKVAVPLVSMSRAIARHLEAGAAAPAIRLRGVRDLIREGIDTEVRLEPLIAGMTDTRENLVPLFSAIARSGGRAVVAHYLFLHPAMQGPLAEALGPLGWSERLEEAYLGGPVFGVGSYGTTKHLPVDARKAGLARLIAWAAEFGLTLTTGHAQNPDLPRLESTPRPMVRPPESRRDVEAATSKRRAARPPRNSAPVGVSSPVEAEQVEVLAAVGG